MTSAALRTILEPAYGPCIHFNGVCRAVCIWKPEKGHIPRGFGGASGQADLVRLVLVTAEPGDPADDEQYQGSATMMLTAALENRKRYLVGGLRRNGRAEPYHEGLRRILKLCWSDLDSLETQLARTWITNSVKCSALKSGGQIPSEVERVCVETYLQSELSLFRRAFVLALGGKAKNRLERYGIRVDAIAQHPSARRRTNAELTWKSAAQEFQEWLNHRE